MTLQNSVLLLWEGTRLPLNSLVWRIVSTIFLHWGVQWSLNLTSIFFRQFFSEPSAELFMLVFSKRHRSIWETLRMMSKSTLWWKHSSSQSTCNWCSIDFLPQRRRSERCLPRRRRRAFLPFWGPTHRLQRMRLKGSIDRSQEPFPSRIRCYIRHSSQLHRYCLWQFTPPRTVQSVSFHASTWSERKRWKRRSTQPKSNKGLQIWSKLQRSLKWSNWSVLDQRSSMSLSDAESEWVADR